MKSSLMDSEAKFNVNHAKKAIIDLDESFENSYQSDSNKKIDKEKEKDDIQYD